MQSHIADGTLEGITGSLHIRLREDGNLSTMEMWIQGIAEPITNKIET